MIVVSTVPNREYLLNTVTSIDLSAQSKTKIVLCDGDNFNLQIPKSWDLVYFQQPKTSPWGSDRNNKFSMWEAFRLAININEDLLFFEDDLIFSQNAASLIENFIVPKDTSWISFFSPFGTRAMPNLVSRFPAKTFLFSQCIKFPLDTCKLLYSNYNKMLETQWGGSDEILSRLGEKLNLNYGIFFPSLVQHVGEQSFVGNGRLTEFRTSSSFRGIDYNANLLDMKDYI